MKHRHLLVLLGTVVTILATAAAPKVHCPVVKLEVERLPDLHVPRSGHHLFFIDGEVVVMGGHTSGFVPTATAEYYRDGEWHVMPMVYPHDQGMALRMKDGKVMLAGGHEQPLGIGQLFSIEFYDSKSHSFEGYGCMDRKRCFASGLELDSGRVVVTGNWFQEDGIEEYVGSRQNISVKASSQNRSMPYVFRTSREGAIVLSGYDNHAESLDTIVIDRLHGEPFTVPLFSQWHPFYHHMMFHSSDAFIGDESKEVYAYLMTVKDSTGKVAFVRVEGEEFTLLHTDHAVPMEFEGKPIEYFSHVVADRDRHRAYIAGVGSIEHDSRLFVVAVDYEKVPATMTFYYTDVLTGVGICQPVLTAEGNLVLAGGTKGNNYKLCAASVLLPLGTEETKGLANVQWWWYVVIMVLLGVATALVVVIRRKRLHGQSETAWTETVLLIEQPNESAEQLFHRICQLMEEQRLYLNGNLKIGDVANLLNSNITYVSSCINTLRGCNFSQFVNSYRVEYSKQLLHRDPNKKLSLIAMESGFATETAFFRNFKNATGMTPKEWLKREIDC